MAYNELTAQEKHVILNKGTERSFTGKYWNYAGTGVYTCRQCNSFLQMQNLTPLQDGQVLMIRLKVP